MTAMVVRDTSTALACAEDVDLYLHPLLEDPPDRRRASASVWREYLGLVAAARARCAACPLLPECLYSAVVRADVSGYVGCTTPAERAEIRERIGASPAADDLDAFAGIRGDRQAVDHDLVLSLRAAHPDESLRVLASRLGCSLSTVKRHMRRARLEASTPARPAQQPAPPTLDEVFTAFEEVVEPSRGAA